MAADSSGQAAQYRLEPGYLFQSPGILVAALLGIILLWRKRRLSEVVFPLVLLVTVFLVFFNHHPWWYYYGIHFAIPLALLGGWGAAELLNTGIRRTAGEATPGKPVFTPEISMMLGAFAVSLWAGFELSRGYENTLLVSQAEQIIDNGAVSELKKYKGRVKWVFTPRNILAAQTGYVMPPELTILAKKRYWTGKITDQAILETVKHYQCEILILNSNEELKEKSWNHLVDEEYIKTWSQDNERIFVAKRLNPTPEPKRDLLLKQLGL